MLAVLFYLKILPSHAYNQREKFSATLTAKEEDTPLKAHLDSVSGNSIRFVCDFSTSYTSFESAPPEAHTPCRLAQRVLHGSFPLLPSGGGS